MGNIYILKCGPQIVGGKHRQLTLYYKRLFLVRFSNIVGLVRVSERACQSMSESACQIQHVRENISEIGYQRQSESDGQRERVRGKVPESVKV